MPFQPGNTLRLGKHHTETTKAKLRGRIPWIKGKHLSAEHKAKLIYNLASHLGKHGPEASAWKGGRPLDGDGYRLVWKPDHPAANKKGYVKEHRLIAEEILGRLLEPAETVHHDNEDKLDQRPENLIVCQDGGYHRTIHNRCLTPATIDPQRAIWLGVGR